MKKILCGFAFLLFGIAMTVTHMNDPDVLIIHNLPFDHFGIISSVVGLVIVVCSTWSEFFPPKE